MEVRAEVDIVKMSRFFKKNSEGINFWLHTTWEGGALSRLHQAIVTAAKTRGKAAGQRVD